MSQAENLEAQERVADTSEYDRACTGLTPAATSCDPSSKQQQVTVSIIIKALNEQCHIASSIESALASLRNIDGEIILADGGSSDRTVEIARRYPICIVQLNRPEDRSCGAGAQLGFQYSHGRYLLLMDGDMRLRPDFLPVAIETLARDLGLAGVGGEICEPNVVNEEYEQRHKRHSDPRVGRVTRLDGSGFYRRDAIESIGYLTDRNLHAVEEFDLGARLHSAGWTLIKLDQPIVDHEPHTASAYSLLLRRIFNRNAWGPGELIRAAMITQHFWFVVRNNRQWLLSVLVTGWWITLLMTVLLPGSLSVLTAGAILVFPFAGMSLRWRSFRLGLYSVAAANAVALCFWPGLLRPRLDPASWIESTVLQSPQLDQDSAQHPLPSKHLNTRSSSDVRGANRLQT